LLIGAYGDGLPAIVDGFGVLLERSSGGIWTLIGHLGTDPLQRPAPPVRRYDGNDRSAIDVAAETPASPFSSGGRVVVGAGHDVVPHGTQTGQQEVTDAEPWRSSP